MMRGISGFLIIVIWFWLKVMIFGMQHTLNEFDASTRRVVDETTETVAALYDYTLEEAQPYINEITSTSLLLAAKATELTSATLNTACGQEKALRRRYNEAKVLWSTGQTSAALALADLAEGTTSATMHLLDAAKRARRRLW